MNKTGLNKIILNYIMFATFGVKAREWKLEGVDNDSYGTIKLN